MANPLKAEKAFTYAKDSSTEMISSSIFVHTEILVFLLGFLARNIMLYVLCRCNMSKMQEQIKTLSSFESLGTYICRTPSRNS